MMTDGPTVKEYAVLLAEANDDEVDKAMLKQKNMWNMTGKDAEYLTASETVFENLPVASVADVQHHSIKNSAAAARAEIEAALDAESGLPCVFESQPAVGCASVSAGANPAAPQREGAQALIMAAAQQGVDELSIFESNPERSRADVLHGSVATGYAARAQAEIMAASEQELGSAGVVFESEPTLSRADALHGCPTQHARAALAVIQQAARGHGGRGSGVFENEPLRSTASVRHADVAEKSAVASKGSLRRLSWPSAPVVGSA